jgi:hypothetical protein
MLRRSLLASVVALIPAIANAAPPQRTATSIAKLAGTCSALSLDGNDMPCEGIALNTTWSDGRSSFTFMLPNPNGSAVVTFSGRGNQQIHPGGNNDVAVQPIDTVLFNLGAGMPPARPEHVIGSCRFTNPYNGRSTIDCAVESKDGKSTVSFASDGQPPKIISDPRLLRSLAR